MRWLAALLVILGALLSPVTAWPQTQTRDVPTTSTTTPLFQQVAKFAVEYDDAKLGLVEGIALCDWGQSTQINPIGSGSKPPASAGTGTSPSCTMSLRNPQTLALTTTNMPARLRPIGKAADATPGLSFTLPVSTMPGAAAAARPTPSGPHLSATAGETATVLIKNGDAEQQIATPVEGIGAPDDQVTVELLPQPNGWFAGQWRYLADPLTERGAGGAGPIGNFVLLADSGIQQLFPGHAPGGFLGVQSGGMRWRPLLPRVAEYTMLEDQSAFAGRQIRYPMAQNVDYDHTDTAWRADWAGSVGEQAFRTLVLIGRDFPIDGQKQLLPISSETAGLGYSVLATGSGKRGSAGSQAAQQIERAFAEQTQSMEAAAATEFRKLDAVLLRVQLPKNTEPGKQYFTWGALRVGWDLQYGDNTADIRVARMIDEQTSEATGQLALPEAVMIEVQTGALLQAGSLPVILGLPGGQTVPMTATRVAGKPTLYRTAPFTVALAGQRAANGPSPVYTLALGDQIRATVDRAQTQFLRAGLASATAGKPSTVWMQSLEAAWACVARNDPQHPRLGFSNGTDNVAKIPVEWVGMRGESLGYDFAKDSFNLTLGGHAAALVLRDSFAATIREQLDGINAIIRTEGLSTDTPQDGLAGLASSLARARYANQEIGAQNANPNLIPPVPEYDNSLLDAWYRRMQPVITAAPNSPLAQVTASAERATGSFADSFSSRFEEDRFQVYESARGRERYLAWRRAVARAALLFVRTEMVRSYDKVRAIDDCDRRELLKLTGHGFNGVAARLVPLFMKYQLPDLTTTSPGDRAFDAWLNARLGTSPQLIENQLNQLAVPDRIGRSYINHLDETAAAVANVEQFNDLADSFVTGVAATLIPPLAEVTWVRAGMVGVQAGTEAAAAVEAGGKAVNTMLGLVIGLPQYAYGSVFSIWQTYQQYEEVKFAYSTASILGVDRYFEAEQQKTPWWQTALVIFKDTIMQGKDLIGAVTPLRDGLKAWRGEALLKDKPVPLPTLRAMPPEGQQEIAVALLKEKEAAERIALLDAHREQAVARLENLGAEANGTPTAVVPPPDVAALEEQRANPIDPMRAGEPAPADSLREAKTQIAIENLDEDARDGPAPAWVDEETAKADPNAPRTPPPPPLPTAGPLVIQPGVHEPLTTAPEKPPPNTSFSVVLTINGEKVPVTFEVGDLLSDKSTFFNVYALKAIPTPLLEHNVIPPELGQDLVIKLLKNGPDNLNRLMEMDPVGNEGVLTDVVKRMLASQDRLKAGHVHQLPIVGFADANIVLQKRIYKTSLNYKLLGGSRLAKIEAFRDDPGLGEAFAKLWADMRREKLVWLDGHAENIFFELDEQSGKWVAGVLDQDMLGTMGDIQDRSYFLRRLETIEKIAPLRIPSMRLPGNEAFGTDPQVIMAKLLEQWGYLGFDRKTQQLTDGLLTVEQAAAAMSDLPYLPKAGAAGSAPPVTPTSAPVPGGELPKTIPMPRAGELPKTTPMPPPQKQGWLHGTAAPVRVANDNAPLRDDAGAQAA